MSSLTLLVSFDFLMIAVFLSQAAASVFLRTFWLHVADKNYCVQYHPTLRNEDC